MKVSDFDHKKIEEKWLHSVRRRRTSRGKQEYDHKVIEPYWRKMWEKSGIYEPDLLGAKNPFYNLMMFPYPSAEGLHVGNVYAFCGSDVFGRFMRMQGKDVFEPIGLDGFGIHSENFALKIGEHPMRLAKRTEANFYRQLAMIGNGFSWGSKLETYDSNYYKWTQWIFTKLFKAGLAYRGKAEVNWCPTCLTVLSDEQVLSRQLGNWDTGKLGHEKPRNPETQKPRNQIYVCERCETEVVRRELTQWFFRITTYAQKLLDGLDKIDWSERVKVAQRNWIGKSEGVLIKFTVKTKKQKTENREPITDNYIEVFTTRPDTIFGVTFMVLAPEHPLVTEILDRTKGLLKQEIRAYVEDSINKLEAERKSTIKKAQKSGVFTGFHAINPLNSKEVPIYISDYVLTSYGTGAVMGVPGHDQRDWDFAKEYHLDIVEVIAGGDVSREAFTKDGVLVNCGKFSGMNSKAAINAITKYIEEEQYGSKANMWHLRDWTISRQRYWGVPIPMIYCEKCAKEGKSWFTGEGTEGEEGTEGTEGREGGEGGEGGEGIKAYSWESAGWFPVPDADLPLELPYIENFKPTGTGVSPLAADESFVKVKCPGCNSWARRETDVSDTFLDSAWYFLRYPNISGPVSESLKFKVQSSKLPWDPAVTRRWLPVNMYIGGAEHAVLHLLYSRFLTMVLHDLGLVDFEEPFSVFRAHGLLIKDGAKMSKSKGNVVNPDSYIEKYGSDTLRTYLMFCGRFEAGGDFRDSGIGGMSKFLKRIFRLVTGQLGNWDTGKLGSSNPETQQPSNLDTQKPSNLETQQPSNLYMMHKTIKKVTEDIESLNYNTAIAAIMEWVNFLEEKVAGPVSSFLSVSARPSKPSMPSRPSGPEALRAAGNPSTAATRHSLVTREELENLLLLLAPFAPFMCEELWQNVSKTDKFKSIHLQKWPQFDKKLATSDKIIMIMQVNGKVRDKMEVERDIGEDEAKLLAENSPNVKKHLGNSQIRKTIFVQNRLINLVAK